MEKLILEKCNEYMAIKAEMPTIVLGKNEFKEMAGIECNKSGEIIGKLFDIDIEVGDFEFGFYLK